MTDKYLPAKSEVQLTESTAEVAFTTDGGVQLSTLEDAFRFAGVIKKSGMGPKDATEAQLVIAMQKGIELGLTPMDAISTIFVISGKPSVSNEGMLALINRSGVCEVAVEAGFQRDKDNKWIGWCKSKRKGWPKERESWFTWQEAVDAGLTTGKNAHMYKKYPGRMVMWKAVGLHCILYYGDVSHGLVIQQEAIEIANAKRPSVRDITPTHHPEATAADPLLGLAEKASCPLHQKTGTPCSLKDKHYGACIPCEPEDAEIVEPESVVSCSFEGPEGQACFKEKGHDDLCEWE